MLERISMTAFLDFSAALEENEGVALCNSNDFGRGGGRERGASNLDKDRVLHYSSTRGMIDIFLTLVKFLNCLIIFMPHISKERKQNHQSMNLFRI